jgi:hypothetical protein
LLNRHKNALYLLVLILPLAFIAAKVYALRTNTEATLSSVQQHQQKLSTLVEKEKQIREEFQTQDGIVLKYFNRSMSDASNGKSMTDFVYLSAKEEHYLGRIEFMKEMTRTQGFLKENPKVNVSYLLSMNNYRLVHENIHIKREINELLKIEY